MIPIHLVILTLIIFAFTGSFAAQLHHPAPPLSAPSIVLTVLLTHLALVALVALRARRATRLLHQPTAPAAGVALRIERLLSAARWATIALAVLQTWALGFGALVMDPTSRGGWDLNYTAELVLLTPALLSWIAFWAAYYPVERALADRALPYRLAVGLPAHEMPSRAAYLRMQIRHNLYLLIPFGIVALAQKLAAHASEKIQTIFGTLGLIFMLLLVPWLITRLWHTEPLTGPLRARLDALARAHHVRFQNILIWRTHHHVSNAAILGFVPLARFFLMSDALLESLSDQQIEAVFAHEVGHGKHRHMWWYGAAIASSIVLATALGSLAVDGLQRIPFLHAPVSDNADTLGIALVGIFLAVFMLLVFLPLSRRFEHQADWFAAQHMATVPDPPPDPAPITLEQYAAHSSLQTTPFSDLSTPSSALRPPSSVLSTSPPSPAQLARGAALFSSALQQIVQLSNRSLDRGGWFHPSPLRRIQLLNDLAASPDLVRRFNRRMTLLRLYVALLTLLALAVVVWSCTQGDGGPQLM